jgi:hypothetical protein
MLFEVRLVEILKMIAINHDFQLFVFRIGTIFIKRTAKEKNKEFKEKNDNSVFSMRLRQNSLELNQVTEKENYRK